MARQKFSPKYPRRTAQDIIASIAGARPRPAYCCSKCGVVGHSIEEHESKPASVPLIPGRLLA